MANHLGQLATRCRLVAFAAGLALLALAPRPALAQGPGTALSFDGADDRVDCGSGASLEIGPNLSVEAWVKTSQSGTTKHLVGKGKATGFSYMFALDGRRPSVYLGGTNSASWIISPTAIPSARWTHVAFTYNGSQLGSQVKIYIDGVLDRQVAVSGGVNKNAGQPVWIGNRSDLAGFAFQGELDEVRIWNRALSATEIRSSMCQKVQDHPSGMVAYWRFDEGSGGVTADRSPNHNDGTLVNGPAWGRSGAALGDASTCLYPAGPLGLAHPDGDALSADTLAGSPAGVHLYRVDEAPNPATPPAGYQDLDPLRYWGVFFAGGTNPSARLVYSVAGHPGLGDEGLLRLATRPGPSASAWTDTGALPDAGAHELTRAGATSSEVVLGSTGELCADILLLGTKIGDDALFYWTPDCVATTYQVFRTASKADIINGWAQSTPWSTVSDALFVDLAPPEDLVFYEVFPINPQLLRLDWTGEASPLCNGLPCDRVGAGSDGYESDGFCPMRGSADPMVYPWADGAANLAISGDPVEFRVKLTCSDCSGPSEITTIDLLLDRNDDGDFTDAGEVIPLTEVDPSDTDLANGKLYHAEMPSLLARDASGAVRWAMADGAGTVAYAFRAATAAAVAGGPASELSELTLLNSARELIDDLGKPAVEAGAGSYGTDWLTALVYFEEAEARSWGVASAGPPARTVSPYNLSANINLGLDGELDGDWHDALMASAIAESGYTLRNYKALYQTPGSKLYRDTMLDWVTFSQEQSERMGYLQQYAPSEDALDPLAPVWRFNFPPFSLYLEDGASPFAASVALLGEDLPGAGGGRSLGMNFLNPLDGLRGPLSLVPGRSAHSNLRGEAVKPLYTFAAAEWDRADGYLLQALFLAMHGAASLARVYEDPSAGRPITAADLADIEVWLRPEDDARAHAECETKPCPPLNGIDDDGDGLVDDLGYAARVLEEFPGVGLYTQDDANGLSLLSAAADASASVGALRRGMRLVLLERDRQTQYWDGGADWPDATLVYGDGGDHPPLFDDHWSYNGMTADGVTPCPDPNDCADGLPDMAWVNDFVPAGWCPEDPGADPPVPRPPLASTPLTIQGGLGDDLEYWIEEFVKAYNKAAGETYDAACYPEGWAYSAFATGWGYEAEKMLADTTPHYTLNFRDDVEKVLQDNDVDPADLGPDFESLLVFLEAIDVRQFVEDPEDVRGYAPYFCGTYGPPGNTAGCESKRGTYALNGFYGDWDEPTDPVVSGKFWTIEPFSTFNQDASGILLPPCDPAHLGTDSGCVRVGWDDRDGDGKFDLFEPVLMADASTPQSYIDLNGDGQWNGWSDRDHRKALYAGPVPPADPTADPGKGLYNFGYVYFQDPTFGGRLAGMTNEGLNNMLGAVAGWADGLLEYPSKNHAPTNYHMVQEPATLPGANLRLRITAADPDGDALHFKLVLPSGWAGAVVADGSATGVYELASPPGTWGFIGLAYDNVNNLSDLAGAYLAVAVP